MRTLHTSTGLLKLVTLKDFLREVPRYAYEPGQSKALFDTQVSSEYVGYVDGVPTHVSTYYERRAIAFSKGPKTEVLKSHLLSQAPIKSVYKADLRGMADKAALEHTELFGEPTHLVLVGHRKWMVANPEDFRVAVNENGNALMVMSQFRTMVTYVSEMSLEDFCKMAQIWTGP